MRSPVSGHNHVSIPIFRTGIAGFARHHVIYSDTLMKNDLIILEKQDLVRELDNNLAFRLYWHDPKV